MKIGLDIDDCLADFWGAYCKYFDTDNNPKMLVNSTITKNVQNVLRYDKDFWLNLDILNFPDFEPELYCTKRVNKKEWTKQYLEKHNFPNKPVYQVFYQHGNKADYVKGKVDVFVDDSISNFIKLNMSGVPCLLMDAKNNQSWGPIGRIYSLNFDEIEETYHLFKETMFPFFKELIK